MRLDGTALQFTGIQLGDVSGHRSSRVACELADVSAAGG